MFPRLLYLLSTLHELRIANCHLMRFSLDKQFRRIYAYGMEMQLTYTYWKDGDYFVGYMNDYPDDSTQGLTLSELEEALKEVYEIRQEEKLRLSKIRQTGVLTISA